MAASPPRFVVVAVASSRLAASAVAADVAGAVAGFAGDRWRPSGRWDAGRHA